jgi:putative resolvase
VLGVEVQTLRRWEEPGELVPDRRSAAGSRYLDGAKILGLGSEDIPTIGYARVASHDQKNDLVRQQELLEAFCAAKGWRHEVIADLGSGLSERPRQRARGWLVRRPNVPGRDCHQLPVLDRADYGWPSGYARKPPLK